MSSSVIEIEGLQKSYRRLRGGATLAVDGLDLAVPAGGVFGLLGPNGSGKTTTLRCLLGLVTPTAGRCAILGADSRTELARVIGRIGSIVETPAFFPGFSGRTNLELLAGSRGIERMRVDDVLGYVGLAARAGDLVKTYSLGMRQRLGIAAALLDEPEVLLLDEPANGLDPAGIKEVRDLLRRIGDEGRTVLLSSHILFEVEQTCDAVAILSRGRCVAAGPVAEVLATGRAAGVTVRLDDLTRGLETLRAAGLDAALDGDRIRVNLPANEAATVTRTLAANDLYLTDLRPIEVDLETVFLALTRDDTEAGA